MAEKLTINLSLATSLINCFMKAGHRDEEHVASCLADFLASFLNDTRYPLAAQRTGGKEIELKYRLRAFAEPIF